VKKVVINTAFGGCAAPSSGSMVQSLRGQEDRPVKGQDRATYPPSRPGPATPKPHSLYKGEVALRVGKRTGSRRADLLDLLLAGLALFCLGILLSFLATAATTTEVSSAPAGKAMGNVDGEALARLDKDARSAPLTLAVQEGRQTEEGPVRASLLTMLVVAVSPFFTSGLSLLATNSSLKRGGSHSLGFLGGSSSAGCGGASVLGVFLL
jgi:hypothetical protein